METSNAHKIIVYSTERCMYCQHLKDFLKENNVEFTSIDIGKDHDAAVEVIEKSGQRGVPVTDIDGQIIVGFSPEIQEELEALLGLKKA